VPVAPAGKFGAAYCHHCRQPIPAKSNKNDLRATFEAVAAGARPRLGSYAASIVFALIALGGYGALAVAELHQKNLREDLREAQAQMEGWTADPRPGDVEVVNLPEAPGGGSIYTLLKVVSISGDNVTLRAHRERMPHRLARSQSEGFSLSDSDFSGTTFVVAKADIARRFLPATPLGKALVAEALRPQR